MPTVVRENIDDLNAVVTVTITQEELQPKVKSELNKFRKKAQLKGFRKGKTPLSFVKKVYGDSIYADIVNKELQQGLSDFIEDEKLDMLGQPIPSDGEQEIEISIANKNDLVFKFDVGLAPEFEVKGVDSANAYNRYTVEPSADLIDEDLKAGLKRLGELKSVEDSPQEGDSITINAVEMENDEVKEDGWATSFTVLFNDIGVESLKNELSTLGIDDKFEFDINTIEGERTEEHIRKYLLQVTEADADVEIGNLFEGTLTSVDRIVEAEMNQEFFDKYFGEGKVNSEEEARDFIKKDIVKYYDTQADSLFFKEVQDALLEENKPNLPDEFLKRWLVASSEENTIEKIEEGYEGFQKSLRWTMIRSKLAEKFKIEVNHQDVVDKTKQTIAGYYGQYMDEGMMNAMAERFLQDQQQYQRTYEDVLSDRVFHTIKDEVTINEVSIGSVEFDDIMAKTRAEIAAANAAVDALAEEE